MRVDAFEMIVYGRGVQTAKYSQPSIFNWSISKTKNIGKYCPWIFSLKIMGSHCTTLSSWRGGVWLSVTTESLSVNGGSMGV